LFSLLLNAQDQGVDERAQYKKTKVSTETLMGYGVDEYGKALAIGSKKSTRLFDENGNMTTLVEYNAKSEPTKRIVLKYTKDNQILNGLEYKGYDKLVDKYAYTFNKDGFKTKKTSYIDSNKYEIVYKYDLKSNLIEKTKFTDKDTKAFQYTYEYNTNNQVIKEVYWSPEMTITKNYTYNSAGQLSTEKSNSDKYEGYRFEFKYDTLGNKISETQFTTENVPYEWYEYEYTDNKQIKTIVKYNFRGMIAYTWRYFYDAKNNLEFVKIYESDAQKLVYITQYLYKYYASPVTPVKP
jgi:hypothetical protein